MSRQRLTCVSLLAIGVLLTLILTVGDSPAAATKGLERAHALLAHPQDETLLAGTHQGIFRSPDAGATWNRVEPLGDAPGNDVMTLAMHPQTHLRIYAGGPDLGIIKSEDFGRTWERADQGLPSADVRALATDAHQPQQLYAWVADQGLYRSQDGARSWHRAVDGPPNPEVSALASVNIATGMGGIYIYAGTADGVFKNTD